MWAGMAGIRQLFPAYAQQAPGQFAWEREHLEEWLHQHSQVTPLQLLTAGRWWIVSLISLFTTLGYFPLRRLFGATSAALATLLIAWDPFVLGLSRQLHPDGLVASLIFLAFLLFLAWLYPEKAITATPIDVNSASPTQRQPWRYLIASGLVLGLAWLTKTPSIFLARPVSSRK